MSPTRRNFMIGAGAAGIALPLAAQTRSKSPNDRVQIALIGAGGMGTEDANLLARSGWGRDRSRLGRL